MQHSLTAGALLAAGSMSAAAFAKPRSALAAARPVNGEKLNILILGGTGFLGPACVDAAQARGHTITLFNRGITEKRKGGMFPEIEKLQGDRDPKKGEGLKALEGRQWDAVIDTSSYYPRIAKAAAELLAKNVKHYTMVSSVSAYKSNDKPTEDESGELATMSDPTIEEMGKAFENYGALKVLCEKAAEEALPGRVANVRPGYIVGPGDPTPRFPYWPSRIAKGGEVLTPGTPNDPMQVIDVRDLGEWIIHIIENNITGVYNALGPKGGLNMKQFVDGIRKGVGGDATFTWVDADFLEKHEAQFPIWIPPKPEMIGFHTRSGEKAYAKGLKSRPIDQIAKATLDYVNALPEDKRARLTGTVTPEKEKEVLAAFSKK